MNVIATQVAASEQQILLWEGVFSSSSSATNWQDVSLDTAVVDSSGVAIESGIVMRPHIVRDQASVPTDLGTNTGLGVHHGCAIVTGTISLCLNLSFMHS